MHMMRSAECAGTADSRVRPEGCQRPGLALQQPSGRYRNVLGLNRIEQQQAGSPKKVPPANTTSSIFDTAGERN
jgi:hypothetical protein